MFKIALYEPEIPPNTGNIMRLCANTGCSLELIHPLGFRMDAKRLRRAGMDYRDQAVVNQHQNYPDFTTSFATQFATGRCFAFTTKGQCFFHEVDYQEGDVLLFGPETRGLPDNVLASFPSKQKVKLPMLSDSRSLNLSNAVAVAIYEAWRQQNFLHADPLKK